MYITIDNFENTFDVEKVRNNIMFCHSVLADISHSIS